MLVSICTLKNCIFPCRETPTTKERTTHAPCTPSPPQTFGPLEAAFVVAKGGVVPLDLATVTLAGSTPFVPSPFLSFLSVSWGYIGEVDLAADFLRQVKVYRVGTLRV